MYNYFSLFRSSQSEVITVGMRQGLFLPTDQNILRSTKRFETQEKNQKRSKNKYLA
jgi:hypothetical protein